MKTLRRGSSLVLALVLTMLVMGVTVSLFASMGDQAQGRQILGDLERSALAADNGVALRLTEINNGDNSPLERVYQFADGSEARVHWTQVSTARILLVSVGSFADAQKTYYAVAEPLSTPLSDGAACALSQLALGLNVAIELNFDSRLGLPGPASEAGPALIRSDATLTMDAGALCNGEALSEGSIQLAAGAGITGTAQAPLVIADPSQVGFLNLTAPAPRSWARFDDLIDLNLLALLDLGLPLGLVWVGNGGTRVLGPGNYRMLSVNVAAGGELTLIGPITLAANQFRIAAGATLRVQGDVTLIIPAFGTGMRVSEPITFLDRGDGWADAHLEIYANNDVRFDGAGNYLGSPPRPQDFQVYLESGRNLRVTGSGPYFGSFFNPEGRIRFEAAADVFGTVLGGQIDLFAGQSLTFDVALLDALREDEGIYALRTVSDTAP